MLRVENLDYASWQTIYFQRATVILTELVLAYALSLYVENYTIDENVLSTDGRSFVRGSPPGTRKQSHAAALSVLMSPGLLLIDHVHFQYNGFLYGILILSIVLARKPSGLLLSGILFAALLCFKHIYLYLAPAYFVFLLRAYCLGPKSLFHIRFANCAKLASGIVFVAILAFGPFAYYGQIPQVLSRLFPFSRGLCHAYWAPNIWALYSFSDRVLIHGECLPADAGRSALTDLAAPYLKIPVDREAVNSVTRGLVGDTSFAVLPDITPRLTFMLTLAAQIVSSPMAV